MYFSDILEQPVTNTGIFCKQHTSATVVEGYNDPVILNSKTDRSSQIKGFFNGLNFQPNMDILDC